MGAGLNERAGPRTWTLLCVPVSAVHGTGEFLRCATLARALQQRWPMVRVHFVVNRDAPHARDLEFEATLVASSPTLEPEAVTDLIRTLRPDVVLFDNAARSRTIEAAHASGAAVVLISSRPRQRRKGFRTYWMRRLSEHWIAYPRQIAGDLSLLERTKLALLQRPRVRFLGALHAPSTAESRARTLALYGLAEDRFVLFVPGGSDEPHPKMPAAYDVFAAAARDLATDGVTVVVVGARGARATDTPNNLHRLGFVSGETLADLEGAATVIVVNGGHSLLAALRSGRACVAAALRPDQTRRVTRLRADDVALSVPLEGAALLARVRGLLADPRGRARAGAVGAALAEGAGITELLDALDALEALVARRALRAS
jgi:UDP:flavonoid glycosyltransferase YjiC (YdhE family)